MADFKIVSLKQITADPNQPRKFYDPSAMTELTASIKEKGVLQPILIRPKGKGYLLVCGERRYRASKEAGLTDIPAVIRELSDEEALELQIIENLQRKDVHPMEEATAFKSLMERFNVEELSLRVGKSASYVAKRVKLTDLVPDAQELFFHNHFTLSEAIKLSRLDVEAQKEILKEQLPKNWKEKLSNSWTMNNLSQFIARQENELSSAIFKTNDAKLYPEAGGCNTCAFNSANQPLLFDDQKKRICSRPTCFAIKTQRARVQKLEAIAADPNKVCIVSDSWLSADQKKEVEAAKDAGIKILDNKDYSLYHDVPEPTISFEEWLNDEYPGTTETDDISDLKKDYEQYQKENDKELAEYQDALADESIVKAYVITGYQSGKEVPIRLKRGGIQPGGDKSDTEKEIIRIKGHEARKKELDVQTVWTNIRELLKTNDARAKVLHAGALVLTEIHTLSTAIYQSLSYSSRDEVRKIIGFDDYKGEHTFTSENANLLLRFFIVDKMISEYGSHLVEGTNNSLVYSILTQYLPTEVKAIEDAQQEIATTRGERVKARIKALQKKKDKPAKESPLAKGIKSLIGK